MAEKIIYAAESAGTSGHVLISNGAGAPIWKDPDTLEVGFAKKMGTADILLNAGAANNPVYFSNGVPVACSSIAANDVPITNNDTGDNAVVDFTLGIGNNRYTKTVNNVAKATEADHLTETWYTHNIRLDQGTCEAFFTIRTKSATPLTSKTEVYNAVHNILGTPELQASGYFVDGSTRHWIFGVFFNAVGGISALYKTVDNRYGYEFTSSVSVIDYVTQ